MPRFSYLTCCVDSDGPSITDMVERATEVTLSTFKRRVEWRQWAADMGYDEFLPLHKDWHVRFYRSRFQGQPCYFVVHSAIEHVFTRQIGGDHVCANRNGGR